MNYLKKKIKEVQNYLLIIGLLIGIYLISFSLDFLRVDDSNLVELNFLRSENNRLRKQIIEMEEKLSFSLENYDYVIGKVVVRDIHNFYKEVVINKGSNDGVEEGMAVVNQEGLIGVILECNKKTALVKLLSSEYNVSVSLPYTYGNLSMGKITMLDKYSSIKEGDIVYTSGLSKIPAGLLVGEITSVRMDSNALGKEAKVNLVDNKNLNYVAIIKGEI